jgi:hypothetical protein
LHGRRFFFFLLVLVKFYITCYIIAPMPLPGYQQWPDNSAFKSGDCKTVLSTSTPKKRKRRIRFVRPDDAKNPHMLPACGSIPYTGGILPKKGFEQKDIPVLVG